MDKWVERTKKRGREEEKRDIKTVEGEASKKFLANYSLPSVFRSVRFHPFLQLMIVICLSALEATWHSQVINVQPATPQPKNRPREPRGGRRSHPRRRHPFAPIKMCSAHLF